MAMPPTRPTGGRACDNTHISLRAMTDEGEVCVFCRCDDVPLADLRVAGRHLNPWSRCKPALFACESCWENWLKINGLSCPLCREYLITGRTLFLRIMLFFFLHMVWVSLIFGIATQLVKIDQCLFAVLMRVNYPFMRGMRALGYVGILILDICEFDLPPICLCLAQELERDADVPRIRCVTVLIPVICIITATIILRIFVYLLITFTTFTYDVCSFLNTILCFVLISVFESPHSAFIRPDEYKMR